MPSKFERFAAQEFDRDQLDRLTEAEEDVLRTRRRCGLEATCQRLHRSRSAVSRAQQSIMQKLG